MLRQRPGEYHQRLEAVQDAYRRFRATMVQPARSEGTRAKGLYRRPRAHDETTLGLIVAHSGLGIASAPQLGAKPCSALICGLAGSAVFAGLIWAPSMRACTLVNSAPKRRICAE